MTEEEPPPPAAASAQPLQEEGSSPVGVAVDDSNKETESAGGAEEEVKEEKSPENNDSGGNTDDEAKQQQAEVTAKVKDAVDIGQSAFDEEPPSVASSDEAPSSKTPPIVNEKEEDGGDTAASAAAATVSSAPSAASSVPPPPSNPAAPAANSTNPPDSYNSGGGGGDDNDDDDVARKAAVTLAAVAAAASSKHKSPAEAAREARQVAQTFLRNNANDDDGNEGGSGNANTSGGGNINNNSKAAGGGAGNKQSGGVGPPKQAALHVRWSALQKVLEQKLEDLRQYQHQHPNSSSISSASVPILHRLVMLGENSSLLQYLLLLENVAVRDDDDDDDADGVGVEEEEDTTPVRPSLIDDDDEDDDEDDEELEKNKEDEKNEEEDPGAITKSSFDAKKLRRAEFSPKEERMLAQQACDRLLGMLKKMEVAYDSLLDLLPTQYGNQHKQQQQQQDSFDESSLDSGSGAMIADSDDFETPVVVPDLLPPCTSAAGDATLAFFRACGSGGPHEHETSGGGSSAGTAAATASASGNSVDSSKEQQQHDASSQSPVRHGSFLGGMFKRTQPPSGSTSSSAGTTTASAAAGGGLPTVSMPNVPSSLTNVFRKKNMWNAKNTDDATTTTSTSTGSSTPGRPWSDDSHQQQQSHGNSVLAEYPVKIEREMLGLTVENVLERTVVRTVLPGGPAKKAGAKVGSLIVKVANVETKNLTHFETIDELRQSQRPLVLVLKQVGDDALRAAREEMGRLIRGNGFGTILDGQLLHTMNRPFRSSSGGDADAGGNANSGGGGGEEGGGDGRPIIEADLRIDAFTTMLRRRLAEATISPATAPGTTGANALKNRNKDEGVTRIGDKLIWILTLFCVGLEREAARLALLATAGDPTLSSPRRHRHSFYSHTAQDYDDAAKSVSKVLLDYTRKKVDPHQIGANRFQNSKTRVAGFLQHSLEAVGGMRRRSKAGVPPPLPANKQDTSTPHEKPLLQIGDVLQRTRTFLADTTSPPAALLRGELIAFLCDVLDIDAEMELAEEESVSAVAGGGGGAKAGMINDLGSAGSLLKLIVLNCPIMRSPGCEDASARQESLDPEIEEELRRRFGPREGFSTSDVHRLHAGNRFLSVVHRLAASRSTSARITACSLGPVLWGHLDFPHQLQLRGVITRALHDVEVIVRKSTATVLHEIAELVFDRRAVPWLVLMCERAMTDPEPQLRSAAMTLTWHLAEHLPNAFLGNASQGSRYLRRLPNRDDPIFADVYLLQCKLLPVATRLAEDRSPSVRLAVAAQCDRLCDALGDHWSSVIIDVLLALLSDSDDRVRCEAVSCVPRLAEIVLLSVSPGEVAVSEVSILEALVPASIKLQKDPSSSVRIALATAAGELLALLVALQSRADEAVRTGDPTSPERSETEGNKRYKRQVDDRLIPLVQTLLNDKDPEVTSASLRAVTNATRSSVQQSRQRHMSVASTEDDSVSLSSYQSHSSDKKQPVITPVLSEKQVLRLLPTLTELAGSRQWRVRQSAVEIVPALLGCTQKLETRSEISKLCISLMGDKVDAVRKTAAECLCMGGSSLGSHGEDASADWITSIVIPSIRDCAVHSDSKQRLLSLKMVEVILLNGACPSKWKIDSLDENRIADTPIRELAVIALSLTSDRIANVRLNVGRILESVLQVFEEDDLSFIKEVLLQQLQSEKDREGGGDRDVLFFAQRCLNRAITIMEDRSVNDESSAATDDAESSLRD